MVVNKDTFPSELKDKIDKGTNTLKVNINDNLETKLIIFEVVKHLVISIKTIKNKDQFLFLMYNDIGDRKWKLKIMTN